MINTGSLAPQTSVCDQITRCWKTEMRRPNGECSTEVIHSTFPLELSLPDNQNGRINEIYLIFNLASLCMLFTEILLKLKIYRRVWAENLKDI